MVSTGPAGAVQPPCQLHRTGMWLLCSVGKTQSHSHSSANTSFDESDYISPDSWVVANGLAICSAIWKTRDWQIKDTSLWDHEMWKHTMAANQTIWVTPVAAHSKGLCSDETGIELLIGSAMSRLPPSLPGSTIFPIQQHIRHHGLGTKKRTLCF